MDMAVTYLTLLYLPTARQQMEFLAAVARRHTLDTGR
jgi:hypothetical protein